MFSFLNKPQLLSSIKELPTLLEKLEKCGQGFLKLFAPHPSGKPFEIVLDSYRDALREIEGAIFHISNCFKGNDIKKITVLPDDDKDKILAACYLVSERVEKIFEQFIQAETAFFSQNRGLFQVNNPILIKSELVFSTSGYKDPLIKDLETLKVVCGAINIAREQKEITLQEKKNKGPNL